MNKQYEGGRALSEDKSPQVIFQAVNYHGSSSETPPYRSTDVTGRYYGYFENEHREQFIFEYEYHTKTASLWAGDYSWEKPVRVIDGNAPELILSEAERLWLHACWKAATTFERE